MLEYVIGYAFGMLIAWVLLATAASGWPPIMRLIIMLVLFSVGFALAAFVDYDKWKRDTNP